MPQPVPKDDEILVRVRAASVNRSDWEALTGDPFYARMNGLSRPRRQILGSDVAGVVEAVGRRHTEFKPGEAVFGEMESYSDGFAEFVCTNAKDWARKPPGMSFGTAAAIPQAGVIALQALRSLRSLQTPGAREGQSVLVNGAGGGAGSFAIQLAKFYEAEVTAVDHGDKLDFLKSLGADHVVDYTRDDVTRSGREHDLILDVIANRSPLAWARALRPGGSYFAAGGPVKTMLQILLLGPWLRWFRRRSVRVLVVRRNRKDLEEVTERCRSGRITAVIERTYPFEQAADALRHLGEGRVRGKLVLDVAGAGGTE